MKLHRSLITLVLSAASFAQTGPPSGFNVVVPAPASALDPGNFGSFVQVVLDTNGDPALTYEFTDPKGTNDYTANQLFFVRWNRASSAWTKPVQIVVVGDVPGGKRDIIQSLAFDPSNGTFGVAYMINGNHRIDLALSSDGGVTWKTQPVIADKQNGISCPQLAFAGGKAYLGLFKENDGLRFLSGAQVTAASTWISTLVPTLAGDPRTPFSMNVDSTGTPGIAFWMYPTNAYNSILGFWRPGFANTVKVTDTNNVQNDDIGVNLKFSGTNPYIAVAAGRDPNYKDTGIYVDRSGDGGKTWAAPVQIPVDRGQSNFAPVSVAAGSKGQGAVTMLHTGGNDAALCGDPPLSRATDFVNWQTCSPGGGATRISSQYGQVLFDSTDRLMLAFQNLDTQDLPSGVLIWIEPSAIGNGPLISSGGIGNAASFTNPVAPGSLATIFGTSFLSGAAVSASATPLPNSLGNVTVFVNGVKAPLVYVGPSQINFQMPYETSVGIATVSVTAAGTVSPTAQVTVAPTAPGIFVYGNNQGVVQNQDYAVNSLSSPAKVGSYVIIYATGIGLLDNAVSSGTIAPNAPLSRPLQSVNAILGGKQMPVAFAGLTPGFVGLVQVNAQIPALAAGSYPLTITIGGKVSNAPLIAVIP